MKFYLLPVLLTLGTIASVSSAMVRKWRDTETGAITLEEAWTIPALLYQMQYVTDRIFTNPG